MDLMSFFDPNAKSERRAIIAGGLVNAFLEKDAITRPFPSDNRTYAEKFQESERQAFLQVKVEQDEEMKMDFESEDGACGGEDIGPGLNEDIYKKYNFTRKKTPRLPILKFRKEILETLEKNPVVVIEGATGCGKTTQVPQYIMDDAFEKKKYFNIVVTQPRRLAAISVAKRVADERRWELGEIVGFQIGRKREVSEDTRITFCTTGVLLEKLVKMQNLEEYTHIILDEVHERDIDMDFLLIVIRKYFYRTRNPVKVIMMSATFKSELFASYFSINDHVPVINMSKSSPYVVKEYYLDDIKKIGYSPSVVSNEPDITPEMYTLAAKLVLACDRIEKKDLENRAHDDRDEKDSIHTSVLVFLPGIHEIHQLHKELDKFSEKTPEFKCEIVPLHSSLTHEEQQRVFKVYPADVRKVILSTNIAESSITVSDVRYVIDFCLTKNIRVDSGTNFSCLKLEWASLDNCRQRSGRAGRVMHGKVYRLVTRDFYENTLPKHIVPEMKRTALENVVLKSKLIEMGPPETVLALAMDPPFKSDIHNAILVLKELGGLLKTVNGDVVLNDGDLTYIGRVMANLPVDVRVSRLIMLGYAFSVLDECIIVGAAVSVQGVFSESFKQEMKTYSTKLAWANGTGSDMIALLNAYKVYTERIKQNQNRYADLWAERVGIQLRMMREVIELTQELTYRLSFYNIQSIPMPYAVTMNDYERCIILKTVFAGAFYPNYVVYGNNDAERERETFKLTSGRNPTNTVILTGMPNKYIGQIYRKTIREMFSGFVDESTNIEINFDHSERVFVTFHPTRNSVDTQLSTDLTDMSLDDDVTGNVLLEVYKAVKFGQTTRSLRLNVMNATKAEEYAIAKGLGEVVNGHFQWKRHEDMCRDYVVYPRKNCISGTLTHFVHLHKFYVQPDEEMMYEEIIRTLLNTKSNLEEANKDKLCVGMMVAAKRRFGGEYYYCRARIVANDPCNRTDVQVFFIDFGNTEELSVKEAICLIKKGVYVKECPIEKLPPRVLECRLACIAPTAISSVRGRWTVETIKMFMGKIEIPGNVMITIYGFIDGMAYVHLFHEDENMNDWAVTKKLAQYTDENYMVKYDHDRRMECEKLKMDYILDDPQIDAILKPKEVEIDPPRESMCDREITLRGPQSPLEALLFAPTKSGSERCCKIDRNSVNCVLLDYDFQDYHHKMVVATHIRTNAVGDLNLINTTLMPNIPGILPLLALIFCPTAEFQRDADNSRFISILTGLGTKPGSKIPLFEEHDMQIPLDVKIDHEDIESINQLRYSLSSILFLRSGSDLPEMENRVRYKLMLTIKKLTLSILTRNRPLCERKYPPKSFVWNQCDVCPTEVLKLDDLHNGAAIFPFLISLKLDPVANEEENERLSRNCQELYNVVTINHIGGKRNVRCLLCDAYLNDIGQVRMHLFTKLHQDREREIKFTPDYV
ncbi:Probable ATP-dependent RNA helicase spindle-E [Sergentomyia squamirostris]